MKVAILIPSTTKNRDWKCITETYLWNSVLTFVKTSNSDYQYKFYIGVDKNDPIYSDKKQRSKIYDLFSTWNNVNIQFYTIHPEEHKGYLSYIWNHLYEKAIQENNDYYYIAGDDIMYCDNGWLEASISNLKSTKDIGVAGCFNGNGRIITQFVVSKKHYEIFKFAYNPKIKNWGVDDHLNELYSPTFLHITNHRCINAGGEPRYEIDNSFRDFYKDLVEEDREILFSWIRNNGGINKYLKKTR